MVGPRAGCPNRMVTKVGRGRQAERGADARPAEVVQWVAARVTRKMGSSPFLITKPGCLNGAFGQTKGPCQKGVHSRSIANDEASLPFRWLSLRGLPCNLRSVHDL